jgi:hypothetical protein
MRQTKNLFLAFCLVALGLPVAQLLGMIDWSWWIVAAPMWLICVVVLGGRELVERLLFPSPPR